jgi:hypothetical protein
VAATKKKPNTSKTSARKRKATKAELRRRAAKAADTRRHNVAIAQQKKRAAAAKAKATRARKAEERARRSEAGKKGARVRKARERAQAALGTFVRAIEDKTPERELERVKASWHRSKRELEASLGSEYERYLEILDDLADAEGVDWDIGYGSTTEAA